MYLSCGTSIPGARFFLMATRDMSTGTGAASPPPTTEMLQQGGHHRLSCCSREGSRRAGAAAQVGLGKVQCEGALGKFGESKNAEVRQD